MAQTGIIRFGFLNSHFLLNLSLRNGWKECSRDLSKKTFALCQFCSTASSSQEKQQNFPQTYGQITSRTHPDIIQEGQVTPGLTKIEFQDRRFRLMELILQQFHRLKRNTKNHLVVIPSASKVFMSDKIPYPFRQNTEFLYLTGFQEPDSVLLLQNAPDKNLPEHVSTLFVPKKNNHIEMWEGPRTGTEGAVELLGVDCAYSMEELENFLQVYARSHHNFVLWYDFLNPPLPNVNELLKSFMSSLHHTEFESPIPLIQQLRLIKSESEIKLMQHSAEIACESLTEVMKSSHPGVNETQLYAKMDFECRIRGAERLAYPPVVAGGSRANIIHYIANNQRILPGDMVLMDAGCEYHSYASDLTRTWPVSGKFTCPQQDLYEIVLIIQKELIELCCEMSNLDQLFHTMCQLMGTKLQELGLVSGKLGKIELAKIAYNFCPHHVSHYLGMDVHDTRIISCDYSSIYLPGSTVITIPGIYIKPENHQVPAQYRGMGIRIEDDILITDVGPEILTSRCPKTIADIEKIFGVKKL
ncbi:probable Xaa-Pro aminopeptidase 3 [Limulus polyphemus]|uniref:Probable Xaa-Pro aminopeptidase 3 n=1 Tax=Limulus polyphemus TaxID=6850 RepID=A0ABM1BYP1_LIMPO|nr:probable Xaa-Pro aminopeptidase 3 [Limulus polyphemus]